MPSCPQPSSSKNSAARHAAVRDWPAYFKAVGDAGPRETCVRAADLFDADEPADCARPPLAIDLGCGTGRDTIHLLERGWRVLALDGEPDAIDRMITRPEIAPYRDTPWIDTAVAPFEKTTFPSCKLFNSSYTLPFCGPDLFDGLWRRIVAALEPGGRLAGQLFGEQDDWATLPDRTHHTRAQLGELLSGFEVEWIQEDLYGPIPEADYPKRWHIYHVVATRCG